ncbi:MAG: hypothetical protein K2M93_00255 [Muribaculaceae bacterium]|nr:hypothetical protein [Muribaculaceae bacterium]
MSFYDEKILPKKGGGRDHISPTKYRDTFEKEKDWIREKCISGEYKFSPYAEKLILKGRGKYPRVLSIPNVRDRFVLSLLNGYLSDTLGIVRETPNRYIFRLAKFLDEKAGERHKVYFYKADISAFYDNINHSVLTKYLAGRIDAVALKLVLNAITVPTLNCSEKPGNDINILGVPQGLSISNILAEIYFDGAHKQISNTFEKALFLRYVDDILIADTENRDFEGILISAITDHNLGLSLSPKKTKTGVIGGDEFEFIGYKIDGEIFSIKESNKNRFADRLVRRCYQIKSQYEDSVSRPRYIKNDEEFLDFAKTDLNFLISGFKVNNHNYGWIAYFQQMNDLKILYQLDRLIRKSLGKELYSILEVNSIVRTYYDLRENMGRSILIDFDKVTERGEKLGYLKKFGHLKGSEFTDLSDKEVDRRFKILIQSFIKSSVISVGEIS